MAYNMFIILIVGLSLLALSQSISLHDPRLSPGHLEPLGAGRQKKPIEVATHYPSSADFFAEYVHKKKPLVIRSAATNFPGFNKWHDSYFKTTPTLAKLKVLAVKSEKEKKSIKHISTSLKKFLDKHHKENMYVVLDNMPNSLKKDILMPSVLRCKETKDIIEECGIWFGRFKSKLRSEDTDQIMCALSGRLEVLMLPYHEYKHKIKVSKLDKSYTKVDVDRVDFQKYPGLEDVEWTYSSVEEGDCIYIPRKWIQQVSCKTNQHEVNKVVYFIFQDFDRNLRPTECDTNPDPEKATLDKFIIGSEEREREHDMFHKREQEQEERKIRKQYYDAYTNGTKSEESGHKHTLREESENKDMYNAGNEHVHQHDNGSETEEGDEEEDEEHSHTDDEMEEQEPDIHNFQHFTKYLLYKTSRSVNFGQFQDLLRQDGNLTRQNHSGIVFPPSFDEMAKIIFDTLDENRDKILTEDDFKRHIAKPEVQFKETVKRLSTEVYRFGDLADDLAESREKGITLEEFRSDQRKQEEEEQRRAKLSVHDSNEL